ncbi:hypothetical protein D9M71_726490 [compost metagenome]
MGDGGGHFTQANVGLVGNDLLLLRGQLNRGSSSNPVNREIKQQAAHRGQPDYPVPAIEAFNQVEGLPVNFNHRQNVPLAIGKRDVTLDEELLRRVEEFLLAAVRINLTVSSGYPFFGAECLFKLVIQKNLSH